MTYGSLRRGIDSLVIIDDSIVRGTTLKQSIIKILDRLDPKKIIIVSSSPQIRYPDCYGIDMSKMSEFIAFKAAIALLKERGMQSVIDETYKKAVAQRHMIKAEVKIDFQSIEDLHKACPNNGGDWYFSGNYPTPGGNRLVNNAFINYIEGGENKPHQYSLNFSNSGE